MANPVEKMYADLMRISQQIGETSNPQHLKALYIEATAIWARLNSLGYDPYKTPPQAA